MSIVSFLFILFLIITVIIYYIFSKKIRWIILLISSVIFFLLASSWKLLFYLIFGIFTTYIGTNVIYKESNTKKKKVYLFFTIFFLMSTLAILKYINIIPMAFNYFGSIFNIKFHFGSVSLLAPLGISYYTLSLIGYIVDVYRGAYEPQKNIFKLSLFASYYPILVSGPFVRYNQMSKELFEEKKLNYTNIFMGFERILYGFMKKLVIADLLATFVQQVFPNYTLYNGYYILIALIFYAIQIYMDFSGCMDIVIGASKMYGINLQENFESPFFSKNLSEFWRRWHISLGLWGKDYIMYPLLKSSLFQRINKNLKNKIGKKSGKLITTLLAILILWLFIGIWHGASFKYIFCAGILPWTYLTCGQIFEGTILKINKKLKINTECFSFNLFRRLRTFGFMCFIWLFACSPSLHESLSVIRNLFHLPDAILFDSLPQLPLFIIFICTLVVFLFDYLKYKGINVLQKFQEQNVVFKYLAIFVLIIIILMYGAYGPGYNAVDFIYGGF